MKRTRYEILDSIRGLTLISMILYHAVWDMVYIFGINWDWYESEAAFVWQQSICWCFILLSGFCWSLGTRKLKRGLMVFGAGAVVSIMTLVFMPENAVRFGVLTLLGSCMLIMIPLEKVLRRCHPVLGMMLAFGLFLFTRQINFGIVGIGGLTIEVPEKLYSNWFMTYLGFTEKSFYSTDYFSVFPWFFLFLTGYYLYGIAEKTKILSRIKGFRNVGLEWIGKRSLYIYMLHQPVIYGVLFLIFKIG